MIKFIQVEKIYPHPNNPRRDLGDISELAESIKTSGILQNLTVVPWVSGTTGMPGDFYTVIIGHRRLAAAKLAGLKEVPCSIAEMDEKTQVATMLLENMQRSDLTVWEEAQGFQMMLDLGETLGNISQKTGFSETTVRRRVKLLDLNQDKFKESVERGATLMDYAELDKIQSVELKNKVLESIGTSNFKWELQQAIAKEKEEVIKADLIKQLETFATRVEAETDDMYCEEVIFLSNPNFEKPEDAGEEKYYFLVSPYSIRLLKEDKEDDEDSKQQASNIAQREVREQEQKRISELEEISKRAFQLRFDFVKSYAASKKNTGHIIEFATRTIVSDSYGFGLDMFLELTGIELEDDEELSFEKVSGKVMPDKLLLFAAYCQFGDTARSSYFNRYGKCEHKPNEELDLIYTYLEKLGYQMSDEERALQNGTHELFANEET